jgi:ribosomal protein S18 acetylase RimI-like enzyme
MIRAACEADRLSIGRVYCDTWKAAYRGIISDEFLCRLSAEGCAPSRVPDNRAFVYVHDSEVCGIVHFGPARGVRDDALGEIYSIYVLPEFWLRGVGRMLFSAAECSLRSRGFSGFRLWTLSQNTRAMRFYERLGMTVFSERMISIGGQTLPETGYQKQFA